MVGGIASIKPLKRLGHKLNIGPAFRLGTEAVRKGYPIADTLESGGIAARVGGELLGGRLAEKIGRGVTRAGIAAGRLMKLARRVR